MVGYAVARATRKCYSGAVYNVQVEGVESFLLPGRFAVHNCPIVVDASVERLHVQGLRFGRTQGADEEAWRIWQTNNLDGEAQLAHTEAVKLGEAYWLVEPPARRDDAPRITSEHPSQVIVATAPGDHRRRLAALKKWTGDDGYAYANVYLPEAVHKYRSKGPLRGRDGRTASGQVNWVQNPEDPGGRNPLGEVPIVALRNNPSMLGGGQSDLKSVLPLQDAINKLLSDMLIGSEFQAFPQRVLLGAEIPRDENGQPIRAAELTASQSRLWIFENENANVTQFNAANLDNYVASRRHLIENLTAESRTPPHYVAGQMVNVSGDALKAAETGLTAKVRGTKMPFFGEGHEDMMRLAFRAIGDMERANATDAEIIWKDPESRSFGELIDGLVKQKALNVPDEILWEKAGYSPQEIARMKAMQMTDDLLLPPPTDVPPEVEPVMDVGVGV